MEQNKITENYNEEQYLINKCELANAFEVLWSIDIQDDYKETLAYCLSLLNDHLESGQREFLDAGGKSMIGYDI